MPTVVTHRCGGHSWVYQLRREKLQRRRKKIKNIKESQRNKQLVAAFWWFYQEFFLVINQPSETSKGREMRKDKTEVAQEPKQAIFPAFWWWYQLFFCDRPSETSKDAKRWGEGQKRRRSKPGAKISLNSSLMILLAALSYHPPEASKDVQRHKRSKTEEASKRQGFSHIPRLLAVLWWFGLPVQMYIVPGEAVVSV